MHKTTIKQWTEGNLIIHVWHEEDEYADLSYLMQDYAGESKRNAAKYRKQDRERLDAYNRGEWYMTQVCCEISVKTAQNWSVPTVIGRAYVGGVESDSGEYFNDVADDLVEQARHDMQLVKEAICHT